MPINGFDPAQSEPPEADAPQDDESVRGGPEAIQRLHAQLEELGEYVRLYLAARGDAIVAALRRLGLWLAVGAVGLVALSAMLCGVSGLAFAIGVYLPLSSMLPIYLGGCFRALGGAPEGEGKALSDPGVLAASGLVAGEALTGLVLAGLKAARWIATEREPLLAGVPGDLGMLAGVGLVGAFLWRAGRSGAR